MMLEDQDRLGLSLRLGFSDESCRPFSAITSPYCLSQSIAEQSSGQTASFTKGIDVNRAPAGDAGEEEEAGLSSPNSTVSSVNGGGAKREYREISDEEDGGAGEEGSRKKLRLTKEQSAILEQTFREHSTLNPKQKVSLAKRLGLRPRQVEVWFQNRRARTKLKQNEVDCELLKRYCENLAEENRRLQKEIQQLRATKPSPHLYMKMRPPTTTLVMCPSCENVGVPPSMLSPNIYPYGQLVSTNKSCPVKAITLQSHQLFSAT